MNFMENISLSHSCRLFALACQMQACSDRALMKLMGVTSIFRQYSFQENQTSCTQMENTLTPGVRIVVASPDEVKQCRGRAREME